MTAASPHLEGRHPATIAIIRHFTHEHLAKALQPVSHPFWELAHRMVDELPDSPELTVCLRKLLEAKDCAVRAKVDTI